jgi:hypothetical protein
MPTPSACPPGCNGSIPLQCQACPPRWRSSLPWHYRPSSCVDWTDSNLDFDASAASIDRDLNEKLNEKCGIIQLALELKYQIGNLLDYPSLCILRATIQDFRYFWSEEDIRRNFFSPFRSIDKMSSMMEKSVGIVKSGSIWANLLNTYTAD